jgi:hypothetical protein
MIFTKGNDEGAKHKNTARENAIFSDATLALNLGKT